MDPEQGLPSSISSGATAFNPGYRTFTLPLGPLPGASRVPPPSPPPPPQPPANPVPPVVPPPSPASLASDHGSSLRQYRMVTRSGRISRHPERYQATETTIQDSHPPVCSETVVQLTAKVKGKTIDLRWQGYANWRTLCSGGAK